MARHSIKMFVCFSSLVLCAGRALGQVALPPAPHSEEPNPPTTSAPTSMPTVKLKEGEQSAIVFDSPVFNWGKAKGNTTVKNDFFFTNAGNGTLEILNVRPSCSCTVAGEYSRIVEPGQSGKIPVELATGKHNGPLTKTINVETNGEGDKKTVTLTMQGDIWQVIQVEPPSAAFGRLEQQVETERVIKLHSSVDAPLELTDLASSNKTFSVTKRERVPGKTYEIVVKAIPPFSPGSNAGRITLKTNYPEFPTMEIHAYAFTPEVIEVTPPTITVPMGSRTIVKKSAQIRNHDNKQFKVSNPQSTAPGVKCTLNEMQPGKVYQLVVEFPAGFKGSATGDKISLKTDNALMPTVSIPITMQGGSSIGPLPGMVSPRERAAPPAAAPQPHDHDHAPEKVQP